MRDTEGLGRELIEYCEKYSVPVDHVFDILYDQKVVPMIRGKATEYNGYAVLRDRLPTREWSVEKLNLNAQPNAGDEDISITHKRTGIILKVECKNAVRGSMTSGKRAKIHRDVAHCRIKCHRSRSNIRLAGSTNDRYAVDCFDVIISNLSNAIIKGGTVSGDLELLGEKEVISLLMKHYGVDRREDLRKAAEGDWRFVFPRDIQEDGFVPRTPFVLLEDDPNWHAINSLEPMLVELVKEIHEEQKGGKSRR